MRNSATLVAAPEKSTTEAESRVRLYLHWHAPSTERTHDRLNLSKLRRICHTSFIFSRRAVSFYGNGSCARQLLLCRCRRGYRRRTPYNGLTLPHMHWEQSHVAESNTLPKFDNPPVIEVVCGITFAELEELRAVQLGYLWDKLRPKYEHSKEMAPLRRAIEVFEEQRQVEFQFSDIPPLPRTWLLTANENGIVQIQKDRLLHNWKRVEPGEEYPHYEKVIQEFRDCLAQFEAFLNERSIGAVEPLQYELTYVNHVPQGDGWEEIGDVGNIFPDFAWRNTGDRFLPQPDTINWRTSFAMPQQSGRLHCVIRHTKRTSDKMPIFMLEMTARGMASEPSKEAMWSWFDLAHEWIVRGFAEITHESIRTSVWGKPK